MVSHILCPLSNKLSLAINCYSSISSKFNNNHNNNLAALLSVSRRKRNHQNQLLQSRSIVLKLRNSWLSLSRNSPISSLLMVILSRWENKSAWCSKERSLSGTVRPSLLLKKPKISKSGITFKRPSRCLTGSYGYPYRLLTTCDTPKIGSRMLQWELESWLFICYRYL